MTAIYFGSRGASVAVAVTAAFAIHATTHEQGPFSYTSITHSVLTTQLYFPDEPKNRSDGLFRPELTVKTAKVSDELAGRFDFVLDIR